MSDTLLKHRVPQQRAVEAFANPPPPPVHQKKNHFNHSFAFFFQSTVCALYRLHSQTYTRTHTLTQDALSSSVCSVPAVSAANFNQASFSLSPWCSAGAGRNWTQHPPNSQSWVSFIPFSVIINRWFCWLFLNFCEGFLLSFLAVRLMMPLFR